MHAFDYGPEFSEIVARTVAVGLVTRTIFEGFQVSMLAILQRHSGADFGGCDWSSDHSPAHARPQVVLISVLRCKSCSCYSYSLVRIREIFLGYVGLGLLGVRSLFGVCCKS